MKSSHGASVGSSHGASIPRRALLLGGTSLGFGSALGACREQAQRPTTQATAASRSDEMSAENEGGSTQTQRSGSRSEIIELIPLGPPPWKTFDPFLFCVHHRDDYPAGTAELGPRASLQGRRIGHDFSGKDGWSMYHGQSVPGFPRHPHRGFETVTITRQGYVDHSDSLGATARYGQGDVQWMTAGRGIVHAEMFPLLQSERDNPTELFQVWLNLPRRNKFAQPHFSMLWDHQLPRPELVDQRGRRTRITIIAGSLHGERPPAPPPDSWASQSEADVAIWSLVMEPGAVWQLPATAEGVDRTLYFFSGGALTVAGRSIAPSTAVRLRRGVPIQLAAGATAVELLLLQGRPIGEPVVSHGPFVMNERREIEAAIRDYRSTQFGGWPWSDRAPVHSRHSGRFAIHADGRKERPT